jgi:hypothetical protein
MDWGGLFLLCVAGSLLAYALCAIQTFTDETTHLNLSIKGTAMAKIGDSFVAKIAPTRLDGASAVVTDVVYSVDPAVYDIVVADDFLSATITAKAAGTTTVRVTANSLGGVALTAEAAAPVVEAEDLEAVALNLSIA